MTLSLKESFIRHAAYLEGSRSEKRDVCVARESKRCSEASARSVTGGDSKWIAVQPQRPLLGRLCNKRGLAVFLPNVLFMIFAWRHQAHTPAKGRVARTFAFGEAFKVLAMLVLLVVALAVLKAVFLPLIVTWVLVLVVQILAPAVINNKG